MTKPCAVAFMADMHIGSEGTDYEALDRDINIIRNTENMYAIVGGDVGDLHIKHPAAVLAQKVTPEHQWLWIADVLKRLSPKILAMVAGNHELWTYAVANFDPLRQIADKINVPYNRHELPIDIKLAHQTYRILIRHKYRFNSSANPSNSPKQLCRKGRTDADVYVVCDKHEATAEPFSHLGRWRWAVRPSGYQVESEFGMTGGWHGVNPVTPCIVFDPRNHDMHVGFTLRWARVLLEGLKHEKRLPKR
jgi:predicted MPP superfamily phosphohydrolase